MLRAPAFRTSCLILLLCTRRPVFLSGTECKCDALEFFRHSDCRNRPRHLYCRRWNSRVSTRQWIRMVKPAVNSGLQFIIVPYLEALGPAQYIFFVLAGSKGERDVSNMCHSRECFTSALRHMHSDGRSCRTPLSRESERWFQDLA